MDLGSIGHFLAGLGGLWSRAEQYLPLILGIALPLAALVFTFSMLQSFFQDSPPEDYFRIMARFGITLAILGDYRSLFDLFNQLSSDLARHFGDPNSFQAFFQQIQSQFSSLGTVLAFAANMSGSIVTLLTLLAANYGPRLPGAGRSASPRSHPLIHLRPAADRHAAESAAHFGHLYLRQSPAPGSSVASHLEHCFCAVHRGIVTGLSRRPSR